MISVIKLFGRTLREREDVKNYKVDYEKCLKMGMKVGYIVLPDAANKDTMEFFQSLDINRNSTFYKSFKDVTEKNRWELFVDQVLHYASTYGTSFQGTPFIPNSDPIEGVPYKDFKIMGTIEKEEVEGELNKLISSGVAMKQDTLHDILVCYRSLHLLPKIDICKNKELLCILCRELEILPSNGVDILRLFLYINTDSTLLIKDTATIERLKLGVKIRGFHIGKYLKNKEVVKELSKIFFRYKPLILMFKNSGYKKDCHMVNRIRKMADKNKVAFKGSPLSSLIHSVHSPIVDWGEVEQILREVNNYKKVSLMALVNRILSSTSMDKIFKIRNGKIWLKENGNENLSGNEQLRFNYLQLQSLLERLLVEELSKKKCKVRLNSGIDVCCPTSEKNFVGDFPYGSRVKTEDEDTLVGIYWEDSWGARDLDLSAVNIDHYPCKVYNWCNDYYDDDMDVVYSGDMTTAPKGATECFYMKNHCPNMGFNVCIYNKIGKEVKCRVWFAKEKVGDRGLTRSYMVDPNNIKAEAEIRLDSTNMGLGILYDGVFYFTGERVGNQRVIVGGNDKLSTYVRTVAENLSTIPLLRPLLEKAGFTIIDSKDEEVDLDLSLDGRVSLLNLFSKD